MPELPEVETVRRGITPHLIGHTVEKVVIRHPRLRWAIPATLKKRLPGHAIASVKRRAKYLLIGFGHGTLIIHLGMSGSLRILPAATPAQNHDHFDLILDNGACLRLRDPRRFGAVLWSADASGHPLLKELGPEPLERQFNGAYLHEMSRERRGPVKQFLMDSKVVVGVGNIYVNEALFAAGIHPQRPAGCLTREECTRLATAIKSVLRTAIRAGGTTLRDFTGAEGRPGHFQQKLKVYGRAGEPCPGCGQPILHLRQGQRSSYYCLNCQR